jgi:hypothetical protein
MNCGALNLNARASSRETGCKGCRAREGMGIAARLFE